MVTRQQVEAETLETFREELPSVYYSDKPDEVFHSYFTNAELWSQAISRRSSA